MKRYVSKPATTVVTAKQQVAEDPLSDISVSRLIDDGLLALYREIKNLLILSAHGKLSAPDAKDLRDSIKLLFELKEQEAESLRGLTDEQLKEEVKKALNEDEDGSPS